MRKLPDEIKEDDTVCQYCGAPYLIMHEVEKYKKEIAELKKQVYMLQRKDSQSQCQERNSNTQV